MTTHETPDVPVGTVLSLRAEDWSLGNASPGPLVLRVERVRWDLFSRLWSGGYVWVEGCQLRESDRMPLGHVEVTVLFGCLTERREAA